MNTRQTGAGTAQFPNMLKVARELGCQIQPGAANPNVLTGLCPFHEASRLHDAKTLHVDLHTARFWCSVCETAGNPMVFIARVWGISAQETYDFLSGGCEVTARRPRKQRDGQWNKEGGPPEPQNTAVLTLASRHYGRSVNASYTALSCLARLGVEPGPAVEAGFGYCPGEGLREYLEARECAPEEIEESPLFQDITGMEILSGRLTLSDRDYTGATIWMMGIQPEEPGQGNGWRNGRPRTNGLRGRRNQLFNLKDVNRRSGKVVLTDDPRLYLVLSAGKIPAAMPTGARRGANVDTMTGRIADLLARRGAARVIMAMHDGELAGRIQKAAERANPETRTERRSQDEMMRQLDPRDRDLERFAGPRRNGPPGGGRRESGRKNGPARGSPEKSAEDGRESVPQERPAAVVMGPAPATESAAVPGTDSQCPRQSGDSETGGT